MRSPIKSKIALNIIKEYSRKLITVAKNSAKKSIHEAKIQVKEICENLKRRINNGHFALFDNNTENSNEKEFTRKTIHLINQFKKLKNSSKKEDKQKTTSYIIKAIINLTVTELAEEQKSLLNLAPNFVVATKKIPFMDIISTTEICANDLENSSNETDAEFQCQKVGHILNRNLIIKLRDNLSKPQKKKLA